jgi:hypothetical protein
MVEAHPRFRVFATGNGIGGDQDGRYAGTQALNAALLNRFTGHGQAVKIEPMSMRQEREVMRSCLPGVSDTLIKRACDLASRLRSGDGQNPALLPEFSTRELMQFVRKLIVYHNPLEAARLTFLAVVSNAEARQPVEQCMSLVFGKRVVVGRKGHGGKRAPAKKTPTPRTPAAKTAKPATSQAGRVASEVTDPAEVKAIKAAYKGNGGTLSYKQIEDEPKFNLRKANGNTAYRICKRN